MDQSGFWDKVIEVEKRNLRRMNQTEFWDTWDKVFEDEIGNLRRMKFVVDVAPLEIIDKEDDGIFIINAAAAAAAAVENINQIDLVIHIIDHDTIYQNWSLKSKGDSQPQQLNSSTSCHHQHHRDRHHLRDVDEEMIMIACQTRRPAEVTEKLFVDLGGVFASNYDDHHQNQKNVVVVGNKDDDHDYIMSLLNDVDALYELEILHTYEQLEEVKRCITQRISEAKPAIINDLMAKPPNNNNTNNTNNKKTVVRIRVHLGSILKTYYANSAAAVLAAAHNAIQFSMFAEKCGLPQFPPNPVPQQILYDVKRASRSSKKALETKIFEIGDLISPLSSSSSCCPVCLVEFRTGVDKIKKMPCSHVFHPTCLMDCLLVSNACPLCFCELPTWKPPKKMIRYIR